MPAVSTRRRSPGTWLAWSLVVATSALVVGIAAVALRGTRWKSGAVYSDSAFRTQAVTRYADEPAWVDYAYQGLPAYYPPLWPWVQGRIAALLDVPGWTVMKPATLALAVLVPLASFLLWRRVLPELPAALVVAGTALATVHLQKVDQWLVLMVVVPWWLEVVRGIRAEGRSPWPRWAYGLILGGLLVVHTYYFLPLAVATLIGWLVDLTTRRRPPLGARDAVVIGGVGLAVASPYWLPMVVSRFRADSTDRLQMRWDPRGYDVPPLPVPVDWVTALGLVAVVWMVLRLRTNPLAGGLALLLLGGYVVSIGGQWLQRFEIPVLPFKSGEVIWAVFVVGGIVALTEEVRRLRTGGGGASSWTSPGLWTARVGAGVVTVALVLLAVGDAARHLSTGLDTRAAYSARYPDGSYPDADVGPPRFHDYFTAGPEDPAVEEVRRTWRDLVGPGSWSDEVVVTDRADLAATTPFHLFVTWKSIYSHPHARFEERVALLTEVTRCPTSSCAAGLLGDNPFDRVDGIIARREDGHLLLRLGVDNYPEGWSSLALRLPLHLFAGPEFRRADVGSMTVVALR